MQPNGVILVPSVDKPIAPAMTCVLECATAWGEILNLEPVATDKLNQPQNDRTWLIVAIDFRQLANSYNVVSHLIPKDAVIIGFVFDAFFSKRLQALPNPIKRATGIVRDLRRFDAIYTPVKALIEKQVLETGAKLKYMPIGVDAFKFGSGGRMSERFVGVNAYGRQPPELVAALSDHFNSGRKGFFHYTSHVQIGKVTDPARHRDHFWQLLRRSRIALAYAPEDYDPYGRFPCSFVGQRWFESLAAGCVVAGSRPTAAESADLLDWDSATIELPKETGSALEYLLQLLSDNEGLETISVRNYVECLRRHDWRHRASQIMSDFEEQFHLASENFNILKEKIETKISRSGD